jgi:hypothetical protein
MQPLACAVELRLQALVGERGWLRSGSGNGPCAVCEKLKLLWRSVLHELVSEPRIVPCVD